MEKEEILRYIKLSSGRRVCIYRKQLEENDLFILSVYIQKSRYKEYEAEFVFDFAYDVDSEGAPCWVSSYDDIDKLILDLERYIGKPHSEWENFTRTGRFIDIDKIEADYSKEKWEYSDESLSRGASL